MGLKIGPLRFGGSEGGAERGGVFSDDGAVAAKEREKLLNQRVGTVDFFIRQGAIDIGDLISRVTGVRGFEGLDPDQLKEVVIQAVDERAKRIVASDYNVPLSSG